MPHKFSKHPIMINYLSGIIVASVATVGACTQTTLLILPRIDYTGNLSIEFPFYLRINSIKSLQLYKHFFLVVSNSLKPFRSSLPSLIILYQFFVRVEKQFLRFRVKPKALTS
jgi:hypothetical protein